MYFIYVVENLINGKRYVGQTIDPTRRARTHLCPSSKCPYLANAVRKYGVDSFDFILLETCSSLEEANFQEIYWISKLNTLAPFGYNLREGGNAGGKPSKETIEKVRVANLGRIQSKAEKERRAASHRGRKNSPETIEKMRRAASNRPPEKCSMFGKKRSEEWRENMRTLMTKEVCKRGHPLSGPEADVLVSKDGIRNCRICRRFIRSGTIWKPLSS